MTAPVTHQDQRTAAPTPVLPPMIEFARWYAKRGWRVLPLHHAEDGRCTCGNPKRDAKHDYRQGGKHPVYPAWQDNATTDPDQIAKWWGERPCANIGIATGEASGIFVLDVDPDNGGLDSLTALEGEHEPLPETRRHETGSGGLHFYFAWPGFNPRNSSGKLGPGLDIRADGGQVVAPPSVSVKGPYTPRGGPDPVQAPAWLVDMLRPPPPPEPRPPGTYTAPVGNQDAYTNKAVQAECDAITGAPEGTQNDTINRAAFSVGTLVGAGALSEGEARETLLSAARAGNHPEGRALATITSGLRAGMAHPRHPWPPVARADDRNDFSGLLVPEQGQQIVLPPAEEPPGEAAALRAGLLPPEFYAARPIFQHIRQAAHSQGCSADVLFYSTLARLSGMLSHEIRAVTGIAGRGSLNLFVAAVGGAGSGKSTGASLARDLAPSPDEEFRDGLPIGTGEGIAETFMGTVEEPTGEMYQRGPSKGDPVMKRVRRQVRHNAYFYVDEGETLATLAMRTGSILSETLRRAAVGETLGQTNASEERTRFIAAGSYSCGLLVGFQPSTALPLLADASTGTPQRFVWTWANDPSIPDRPTAWPGPIEKHPGLLRPAGPVDITFPDRIRQMLWTERVGRARGEIEVAELDGHAGLMKVKLAALFALLDGNRIVVNEDDWALAEIVWTTSCAVRDGLVARARREQEAERQAQDDAKISSEVRAHMAKGEADRSLERLVRLVVKHSSQVGGITFGYMRRALESKDRHLLPAAVDLAEERDLVIVEDNKISRKTA